MNELRQLAHLSRWLEGRGMGLEGLGRDMVAQFLAMRRVTVGAKASSSLSLSLLLEVLREAGAVEEEPVAPRSLRGRGGPRLVPALLAHRTQMLVAALRAFLRFCFLEGLVEVDLSAAALAMTSRRRSSLPRGVTASQAAALVRSCDRRTAMGRRDYAVILVLSRLGLRASEVAALTLDR